MAFFDYDPVVSRLYEDGVEALSEAERNYVFVVLFDYEVRNGGFHQLLHNHDVSDTDEMIKGLDNLKMRDCAILLRLAIKTVGDRGRYGEWNARQRYLNEQRSSFQDTLSRLDKSFYDRYDYEDVVALLKGHVIAHPEEFARYDANFASGNWN